MQRIIISRHLPTLARNLALWRESRIVNQHVLLDFDFSYPSPASLAMLSSWMLEMIQRGMQFTAKAPGRIGQYLEKMGFYTVLKNSPLTNTGFERSFFLPLMLLYTPSDQMAAIDQLCELVLRQFSNARELVPAFEWAVNELTDNAFIHAQSPTPIILCAQYFSASKQIEIAIADQGVGLLGTLGPSHGARDEKEAIDLALKRGLTRDPKIGQGNGLAGTEHIAERNNGELLIWSGAKTLIKSDERQYFNFSSANGVGVVLRLNVDMPVDLGTTWIGQRPYTYIDRCSENIDNGSALLVRHECGSVGSRDAARRLRNKLSALLPDIDKKVTLDFSGCREPSSSFLDELFGRLIGDVGINAYQKKIRIEGMTTSGLDRANVVIHQRLALIQQELDALDYAPF